MIPRGGNVSHYGDDEEVDNDGLDNTTAKNRFTNTGSLAQYQPWESEYYNNDADDDSYD